MNDAKQKESFLIRMGNSFTRFSQKYMPDPSIFAVILTILAFILGIVMTKSTPMQMLGNWYAGLWELLTFAMQMAVVIITGAVIAEAPLAKRGIQKVASIPKNGAQAAYLVTMITILLSFVHFGLSLAGGALLAKNVAKQLKDKNIPFEYGLLVACAYLGQMTWCVGFSNSVGLTIATPGHFLEAEMGIVPVSEYIFNPMNLTLTALFLIVLPVFAFLLHPKGGNVNPVPDYALRVIDDSDNIVEESKASNDTLGEKLNNSKVVCWILGLFGVIYVIYYFATEGFNLDLNILNTIFMFGGLLLQGTLANYVRAFGKATASAAGIIFQFPLYAGIMGIIKYSGLVTILAGGIASISTPGTFYIWTFIFASIVNMFVPSGGGQWAVQGPIAVASAKLMDANLLKSSMAVAYGNSVTNMCQPFWALALLGFTGLKAKDIMGYSTAIMLVAFILFFLVIGFLPV